MSLQAIRRFFDRNIRDPVAGGAAHEHTLRVATAALLVEITRLDGEITEQEQAKVDAIVRRRFELSSAQARQLIRLAEQEVREATDYYQFTSLINARFTPEQKEHMIEFLWQAAYADGALDRYEEHLVRKIADLIHVPHRVYLATKFRARETAGST